MHYHESKREAQEVVDQIISMGRRSIALCANLANEDQVRKLVLACVEAFDRLDCDLNSFSNPGGYGVREETIYA